MSNTEFKLDKKGTQTKSDYRYDNINLIINAINKTSFHRFVFAIIVIGYIIIAFNGHMNDFDSFLRYSFFIIFSLIMCFVLLFIKENIGNDLKTKL